MNTLPDSRLCGTVTSLAFLWKISRTDGLQLGYTSHDAPINIDGFVYLSTPGFSVSALDVEATLVQPGPTIFGITSSTGIREDDLELGRWIGARFEISICDWRAPEMGTVTLLIGRAGNVSLSHPGLVSSAYNGGSQFVMEVVRGEVWSGEIEPLRSSPLCRSQFGDGACGVSLDSRHVMLDVQSADGTIFQPVEMPANADAYVYGSFRVISGVFAGVTRQIKSVAPSFIVLDMPIDGLTPLDRVRIWEGCDKRFATCRERFANTAAFNGEPHLPGRDALIRYGRV